MHMTPGIMNWIMNGWIFVSEDFACHALIPLPPWQWQNPFRRGSIPTKEKKSDWETESQNCWAQTSIGEATTATSKLICWRSQHICFPQKRKKISNLLKCKLVLKKHYSAVSRDALSQERISGNQVSKSFRRPWANCAAICLCVDTYINDCPSKNLTHL